ncbi:MAG: hypothetical protein JKX98_09935 [Alcanivoracaceae bacterium]|nr:hypothetical protein [Alcanivoracaceae bacterium]
MKKFILLILIVTFVSTVSANYSETSFELGKADNRNYSLLDKADEGFEIQTTCSRCQRNLDNCISTGQSNCIVTYSACIVNCTGMFQ